MFNFVYTQPIADRVAQNLEITSKTFQYSTRHTWILMGFIISTILLLGTHHKSHGYNYGSLENNRKESQDSVPPYQQSADRIFT